LKDDWWLVLVLLWQLILLILACIGAWALVDWLQHLPR
jgi:hypothetical protein